MLLQEIPALPFDLDVRSASAWLDRLPVGNTRECCRLLFPVLQGLNIYPMELRVRLQILEQFRPPVLAVARGLLPYFVDKPLPLDDKSRKISSLCSRFHLELAEGYRQLVEGEAFTEVFAPEEQLGILRCALEQLALNALRLAQIYEAPPSSARSALRKLYRYAEAKALLGRVASLHREPRASIQGLFQRILLFRLAAPSRLEQSEMQRLFDLLAGQPNSTELGIGLGDAVAQTAFWFDPADITALIPALPSVAPEAGMGCISADRQLGCLRNALDRAGSRANEDPLTPVLPRLGDRLPCQDRATGRSVELFIGFDAAVAALRYIEALRAQGKGSGLWSGLGQLELTPRDDAVSARVVASKSVHGAMSVPASEAAERRDGFAECTSLIRSVGILPTDLPGFYLLDSGRRSFRAGAIVALNSDDAWFQVGTVRAGQMHAGRFWHSVELLGTEPRLVRVRGARSALGVRDAFLSEKAGDEANAVLVTGPVKWRPGEFAIVEWLGGKKRFRIVRLLEATTDFCQFVLNEID